MTTKEIYVWRQFVATLESNGRLRYLSKAAPAIECTKSGVTLTYSLKEPNITKPWNDPTLVSDLANVQLDTDWVAFVLLPATLESLEVSEVDEFDYGFDVHRCTVSIDGISVACYTKEGCLFVHRRYVDAVLDTLYRKNSGRVFLQVSADSVAQPLSVPSLMYKEFEPKPLSKQQDAFARLVLTYASASSSPEESVSYFTHNCAIKVDNGNVHVTKSGFGTYVTSFTSHKDDMPAWLVDSLSSAQLVTIYVPSIVQSALFEKCPLTLCESTILKYNGKVVGICVKVLHMCQANICNGFGRRVGKIRTKLLHIRTSKM